MSAEFLTAKATRDIYFVSIDYHENILQSTQSHLSSVNIFVLHRLHILIKYTLNVHSIKINFHCGICDIDINLIENPCTVHIVQCVVKKNTDT